MLKLKSPIVYAIHTCKSKNYFLTFSPYEKVLVLCEKSLLEFSSNLYVLRSPESEKTVFIKVSVCISRSYTR